MKKIIISILFFLPIGLFAAMPAFPMVFYGAATINGAGAPVGTVVRAYYGATLAGQITVKDVGVYGYNSPTKQQLLVGEGSGTTRFTVQSSIINGGQETEGTAAQTYPAFVSGEAVEKNFAFSFTNPVTPVTPSSQSSNGGGGGSSYSPTVVTQPVIPAVVHPATTTAVTTAPASATTTVTLKPVGQVLGATFFVFSNNLTLGSRGTDVTELQKRLAAEGFLSVAPTGYFGAMTKTAVIAYQKSHKISPASGYVGAMTRAELNK
jgi:hypothetical protein